MFLSGTSLLTAYGGPAYSVSRLATALASQGAEVGLWAPDGSALTTTLVASAPGLRRLGGSLLAALSEFSTPDVIHDNGLWLRHNHAMAVVAAKRGIPRVVSTRGMLEPWAMNHKSWKKQIAWAAYQRRDLGRAGALHATSEAEKHNLEKLRLPGRLAFIPNGVDVPEMRSVSTSRDETRTALFLGRLYPVKGLPMLIEAWANVMPRGWRLVIAGPDEAGHRALLERMVVDRNIGSSVVFAGPAEAERKSELFASSDLFILPTHSESFGMAIGEAFASGLPVLTTTAAPWPQIESVGCGWRVMPTVADLARGLQVAASRSLEDLQQMGQKGREMVSELYDWRRIAARFLSLYSGD